MMQPTPISNVASARKLYIDLMIRVLCNTIYEDGSIHPYLGSKYDADARLVGKDWPAVAHTMVGAARLKNLADLTEKVLATGIKGDLIETGVWRGGCCILMRAILAAHGDTERKVIVADSFEGLPPPAPGQYAADEGDQHYQFKELSIPLSSVRDNFRRYGLLDDQVFFLKGFFSDTLPNLRRPFAIIRLDGDMYESTMVALKALYPHLSPGGYVVIDDYGAIEGCKVAVDDYRRENRITTPMTEIDWTGVWWQK